MQLLCFNNFECIRPSSVVFGILADTIFRGCSPVHCDTQPVRSTTENTNESDKLKNKFILMFYLITIKV